MRRSLAATAAAVLILVGAAACEPAPAPKVTATPSTLKPACGVATKVTGKVTPAGSLKTVVLEFLDGKVWKAWKWFETGAPTEGQHVIKKSVPASGSYSLTYAPPPVSRPAIRLRVRGYNGSGVDNGVGSASWVSTRAQAAPC